ncbi:MAG: diaminopimelate epimerase [Oscillospiraceae bacterium]
MNRSNGTLTFTKMEGCGNDYVYIDCFEQQVEDPGALSIRLSDRHFGVGSDGVILICPSEIADGRMRMFNADGSEGRMCGNGLRCVGRFLYERRGIRRESLTVETLSGVKNLRIDAQEGTVRSVQVDMGAPVLSPEQIPVNLPGDRAVGVCVPIAGTTETITCVSMGNPHCVIFTTGVEALDLEKIGPGYENDPLFPERVNTEFVEVLDEHTLHMRVWERGSGETLACGTGTCAAVVAAVLTGVCPIDTDVTVHLRGGSLIVRYTGETVWMTGPATFVFEGEIPAL